TQIPITAAEVTLGSYKTKTDKNGKFIIQDIAADNYNLAITANGYETYSKTLLVSQNITTTVELDLKTIITLDKQVVLGTRDEEQLSYYAVDQKSIARLAEATLFSDTMNSLKMLPGVASKGSFDSKIYIRGGSAYEMIGIIDNIPMYDPYFWNGRLSIFNSTITDHVEFYPGGFHAKGGQSLSGIIDVQTIDGDYEKKYREIDVNLTELNMYQTAPLQKNKTTYMLSYRRTYYDFFAPLFFSSNTGKVSLPYLTAFQAKITTKLTNKQKLKVGAYYFNDGLNMPFDTINEMTGTTELDENGLFKYDLTQSIFTINHTYTPTKKLLNELTIGYYGRDGLLNVQMPSSDINDKSIILESSLILKNDISWDASERHHIEFGGLFYNVNLDNTILFTMLPNPEEPGSVTTNISGTLTEPVLIGSVYMQDHWKINNKLSVIFGARLEQTKYSKYNWNIKLDPRLQIKYYATNNTTLKTYIGSYRQQFFENNNTFTSLTDLTLEPADIDMSSATHVGIGIEHFLNPLLLTKAELFYKNYEDLAINTGTYPESNFTNNGIGNASGIELLIQQLATKHFNGWGTYTYSKTRRRDHDGWYTPDFDITHMLNLFGDYKLNKKNHIITTVKFSSGTLYTPILGTQLNESTGNEEYNLGPRNSKRMQDYIRIDLWYEYDQVKMILPIPFLPISKNKLFKIFPYWILKGSTRLGIHNLLNKKNPVDYYWDSSTESGQFINDYPLMIIYGYKLIF
ncbi:hypothetical protein DID76_04540, partial [Candidatus Marinamargulisbacteria bacterium SCGC AG-414-C22]